MPQDIKNLTISEIFRLKSFLAEEIGKAIIPIQPDKRKSAQLPLDLEKSTGITGISNPYLFPDQKSASEYDLWAGETCTPRLGDDEKQTGFLKNEWTRLVKLNPCLGIIKTNDNPRFMRNVIFGAATLFNPDDISFFIEVQRRTQSSRVALLVHQTIPAYGELVRAIESRTNQSIQWIPSPATLVSMYRQVKNRPAIYPALIPFQNVTEKISSTEREAAQSFIHCPSLWSL